MENLKYIGVCFFEILFLNIFLETFCDYKNITYRKCRFLIVLVSSVIMFIISGLLMNSFLIKELIDVLLLSIIWKQSFEVKFSKITTLVTIYVSLLLLTDYVTLLAYSELFFGDLEMINTTPTIFVLIVTTSKTILFLVIIIVKNFTSKGIEGILNDTEWIKFLFLPIFSVLGFSVVASNGMELLNKEYEDVFWLIGLGVVGINFFVFYLLQDVSKRELKIRENKIAEVKANNQLLLYQSIVENFDKQNEKLHEYKNQVECLQTLSEQHKYNELDNYLNQIGGELVHELDVVDTHHSVVNAIINRKYQEALRNGIIMVFNLTDLSELWLREKDIVLILANLLDNAIEACKKIDGRRVIKIKIDIEEINLVIAVSNTYSGKVRCENGVYLSTKDNARLEHGIGIKNIIKAVEKYRGMYAITPTDDEFIFTIMIPKNKAGKSE